MDLITLFVCLLVFFPSLGLSARHGGPAHMSLEKRTITPATGWTTGIGDISEKMTTSTETTTTTTETSGTATSTMSSSSSSTSHSTSSKSSDSSSSSDKPSTSSDSDDSSSTEKTTSSAHSSASTDDASSKTSSSTEATATSSEDSSSPLPSTSTPLPTSSASITPPPTSSPTSSSTSDPTASATLIASGDSSSANTGTIIGVVVGVAGFFIILAIFLTWFIRRRRAIRARRQASPDWDFNHNHHADYLAPNPTSATPNRNLRTVGAGRFYAEADPTSQVHEVAAGPAPPPARPSSAPMPGMATRTQTAGTGEAMEMRENPREPRVYRGVSVQEQQRPRVQGQGGRSYSYGVGGVGGGVEVPESLQPGRSRGHGMAPPWGGEQ